ncbi:hypothetical protein T11_4262 [Trichinella zimbabwensis]|uniref:Uncharacterized protein n=1 Tax=Trichinella zimbabwensis TaxID=268475 RepID=A0A0V1HNB8_9BILA|nr:hypothetical protein T11_4262 [Trichinella zimbabwensis]KRZ11650.1 hypothetical protein T11_4262 [Trichinella zimbabwensis]
MGDVLIIEPAGSDDYLDEDEVGFNETSHDEKVNNRMWNGSVSGVQLASSSRDAWPWRHWPQLNTNLTDQQQLLC